MSDALKELTELSKYLQLGSRLDLKDYALTQILSLTGSSDGLELVLNADEILLNLLILLSDPNKTVSKDACLILVNLSSNTDGAKKLVNLDINRLHSSRLIQRPDAVAVTLINSVLDPDCHYADAACMTLANLSRCKLLVEQIIDSISEKQWEDLLNAFTNLKFNKRGCNLDYLGPIFSNFSQSPNVRRVILRKSFMEKIVAFTQYEKSIVRRGGIIGTIKNCCFDSEHHEFLLGDSVDILPKLLLPLAGPEEFDDEDMEKLPMDLQYLPEDKQREEDPDLRCMLLEALTQLCALRKNREFIRSKNAYVILRELHKNEKNAEVLLACENLVDILIRTEEEINEDNLKEVEIPQEVIQKLEKLG